MDTWTSNGELPWWRGRSGERHREEDEKREKRNVGWGRLGKARKGGQVGGGEGSEGVSRREEAAGSGKEKVLLSLEPAVLRKLQVFPFFFVSCFWPHLLLTSELRASQQ